MTSKLSLVVAMDRNGVIGCKGRLSWRIPADMRRFKALTMGKPIIMGRRTWDSLPKKPLEGRINIVVSRNPAFVAPGATLAPDFETALAAARGTEADEIMVIGGADIYATALPHAERLYLTELQATFAGDAFFPPIDRAQWREIAREGPYWQGPLGYFFLTLERNVR